MEFPLMQLLAVTGLQLFWGIFAMGGGAICWHFCEKARVVKTEEL